MIGRFAALLKKELTIYYSSPIAYSLLVSYSLIAGLFLYTIYAFYSAESLEAMRVARYLGESDITVAEHIVRPFFNNMGVITMMMIPALTMRLFAEERRSGSIEFLFTWPLSDLEIVLAKFSGAAIVYLTALALTVPFTVHLGYYADPPYGQILCGYLALFLTSSALIALGLFVSSLTESQLAAATWTFGAALFFWAIGWTISDDAGALGATLKYIAMADRLDALAKGTIDTEAILYYFSFVAIFLFGTLRALESRLWRS